MSTANVRVSPIRGTADAMSRHNIVLLAGEQGYETDTGKTKRGNGSTAWNSLPYDLDAASVAATQAALAQADSTAAPLWTANYDRAGTVTPANTWSTVEAPAVNGTPQPSRIAIVDTVPGIGDATPTGRALHVTLNPYSATNPGASTPEDGDVFTDGNGYKANRAEVYGRNPAGGFSTPAAQWPDPVGTTRWYGFSILIPAGFTFASDATWLSLTQWKGLNGNQAPIFLGLKRGNWNLGGSRTDAGLVPNGGDLRPVAAGAWTRFEIGVRLSTDPTVGWLEVWQDGAQVLARTTLATMDTYGGAGDAHADPIYLKQGIYRPGTWTVTHQVYFGPVKVGSTRTAVTGEVLETAASARARTAGGGSLSIVDNGDGTLSSSSSLIVDNGDGTLSAA